MLEFLPGFMYTMYTWFLIADCKYSNGDCMQARDCWWFSTVAVSTLEGTKSLKCSSYTICLTPVLNMIITLTCWSVCWLAFCFFTNRLYWLYLLYSSIAKVFLLDLSMEVAVILTLILVHHLFDVMWDSGDPLTIDQHLMNGLSACNRHLCLCYNKA